MNNEKLSAIFNEYFVIITAFIRKKGVEPDTAEDLAQMVFMKFANQDAQDDEVRPFLFRIASTLYIDWLRARKRNKEFCCGIKLTDDPEMWNDNGGYTYHSVTQRHKRECLSKENLEEVQLIMSRFLNNQEREALELYANGWGYANIAKETSVAIYTIKNRIYSGRKKIQEKLLQTAS